MSKFNPYNNFHIVNDDFETHDFGEQKFDLIFSAATIQWIPEEIGFTRTYDLLKQGGTLAMFMTISDEKSANEELYDKIDQIYKKYFHVETKYTCKMNYDNVVNYGFVDYSYREWEKVRVLNADEYISWISTHIEHITLQEPYKSRFYNGIREVIIEAGNKITINDTIALHIAKKP